MPKSQNCTFVCICLDMCEMSDQKSVRVYMCKIIQEKLAILFFLLCFLALVAANCKYCYCITT